MISFEIWSRRMQKNLEGAKVIVNRTMFNKENTASSALYWIKEQCVKEVVVQYICIYGLKKC